jgi:hypothetical protein
VRLFSALILDRIQVLMKEFLLEKLRQYFEHFRFSVGGEWYIIDEFHGREDISTLGRLGDIRGKPTVEDLGKN